MDEMNEDAVELLRRARAEIDVPPEREDRVRTKLLLALGAPLPATLESPGGEAPAPAAADPASWLVPMKTVVLKGVGAVALVCGLAVAATFGLARERSTDAASPSRPRGTPSTARSSSPPVPVAPPRAEPTERAGEPALPMEPSPPRRETAPSGRAHAEAERLSDEHAASNDAPAEADDAEVPPSVADPSALAEEARLLRSSLEALSAGDRDRARLYLDAHEERFPQGVLRAERERARARLERSAVP